MGTQSSQRQTQARGRAICRTCKSCRQKKVKCDGQHPKCGTCRRKNQDCEYPRDGRKTAVRAKKEDIKSLEEQVEELKGQIRRRATVENASSTDNIHPHETLDHSNSGSRCSRGCPNEPKCDQSLQDQLTCQNNGGKTCPDPDPLDGRQIQVYGATSLLPSYLEAPADCQTKENNEDSFLRSITRDRLIAFSAIIRQKETIIYSTPSIAANIDFDGASVDMAMHLLELHWNRLHFMYLLTYRPLIMDSLFNNGPYMNKLLLNAIYLQSSLYSDRVSLRSGPDDSRTMGMAFYDRFKTLLIHYVDKPSLPTVVALLTCGACLLQYGKQSASWVYCGMAYRMIIDLGYHLEDPRSSQGREDARLSALDKEVRRRVYWGAYANDKFQSLYLGRPPGLQQSHSNVPRDLFDSYEELEEWKPYIDPQARLDDISVPVYPGRPSYALSTFQCLLQLSVITEAIISAFYSTKDAKAPEHDLLQSRQTVKAQLDRWRETLPAHLLFDPKRDETPPPHQMTLYTTYWTLVILTEQPFLARGHFEFTAIPELQNELKKKCIEASLEIRDLIEAYRKAFSLRRAQYGISYAMYSAVIVLLQHTDQDCDEYTEAIRFFWLALLEYQNGCGHGLKGPLRLLKSLMRRVEKVVKRMDIDHPGTTESLASNDTQFGIEAILPTETFEQGEAWSESWLNVETDDLFLADDTIFGFFAQE
ncbi:fungal-specific transcription factor domain-containing protein [Aspergillus caelatus]|uniref:Fungal-specific transcription factor domain-containing protein n=1 Tax=Aspergillus caelatus TaxID=61420 RepID=A0A5N7A159_9EURO|nr:fungal-specific transcription factor domain-containing protein [Aspergillus caelatus]KAE8363542.1 fungal-specific transcription factor domain-containing protein [Aspergillus caelatus]